MKERTKRSRREEEEEDVVRSSRKVKKRKKRQEVNQWTQRSKVTDKSRWGGEAGQRQAGATMGTSRDAY